MKHRKCRRIAIFAVMLILISSFPAYAKEEVKHSTVDSQLGMIDSYAHILTCLGGFNLFFLYYMAFFKNLSWTYAEAAMMDGAGHFGIFYRVMLPQAKPIFGALFLTQWITGWNNYESNLIYLPMLPSLPVGIYQFHNREVLEGIVKRLDGTCGLSVCEKTEWECHDQWAYPSVWPPICYFVYSALEKTGSRQAKAFAQKYMKLVEDTYSITGRLWEKYDAEKGGVPSGLEYDAVEMLGWTAGVYLYFLGKQ